jgi:hypothetical protein
MKNNRRLFILFSILLIPIFAALLNLWRNIVRPDLILIRSKSLAKFTLSADGQLIEEAYQGKRKTVAVDVIARQVIQNSPSYNNENDWIDFAVRAGQDTLDKRIRLIRLMYDSNLWPVHPPTVGDRRLIHLTEDNELISIELDPIDADLSKIDVTNVTISSLGIYDDGGTYSIDLALNDASTLTICFDQRMPEEEGGDTATYAHFYLARYPGKESDPRHVEPGSVRERAICSILQTWLEKNFSAEQHAILDRPRGRKFTQKELIARSVQRTLGTVARRNESLNNEERQGAR